MVLLQYISFTEKEHWDLGQKGWVSLMHAPQRRKADKAVKGGSHPAYSRVLQELKGLFNRQWSFVWRELYRDQVTGTVPGRKRDMNSISLQEALGDFYYIHWILNEIRRGFLHLIRYQVLQYSFLHTLQNALYPLAYFHHTQVSPRITKDV